MSATIVAPHPPATRVPPSLRIPGLSAAVGAGSPSRDRRTARSPGESEGLGALFSLSPRCGERVGVRGICAGAFCGFVLALCFASGVSHAQDTAAEEVAHRAEVIAHLPHDAAKRLFGRETVPAPGPAEAIGSYERGCLGGAVALPANGPNWQVMRPSRNRAWGHPVLIAFIEQLAPKLPTEAGWPGLLVGDIAQPRGGPMLTGHGSHQIGLDADIWLTPMPDRRLSPSELDEISATDVVAADGMEIDPTSWTP